MKQSLISSNQFGAHSDGAFIQLGTREIWGQEYPFGLAQSDRLVHTYMIGKSGSGKSTLLKAIAAQLLEAGCGFAIIDPHGDLAESLLAHVPPRRFDDVVYFDAADLEYPIGINPLAEVPVHQRHLVVDGIVGSLRSLWGDSWGPRLGWILVNSVAALLECQNVSLLALQRMLVDARYLDWVVRQVKDPITRQFWLGEWTSWDERFRAEATAPVLNKVGQLLSGPLRPMLGQVHSKLNFRWMMDHRRVLIANLSKGRLGPEKSNLLGSLLVTQLQLAAMSRADLPLEGRVPFDLLIDEFANFSTNSFASMLAEIRKSGIAMTLANQHIGQLTTTVRDAVFGNCGTLISFRVGESDAAVLAREFGDDFAPKQFTDLRRLEVCVKLLEEGMPRAAFVGKTFQFQDGGHDRAKTLLHRSRERYATPRAVVEEKIRRWSESHRRG
jgi:TraM recognition site of TraD and TraG/Helicase HerA, central domain